MEDKDVFKYSLKRDQKFNTFPTKASIKCSSKGESTFISDLLFSKVSFWQVVVISAVNADWHAI